MNKVLLLMIAVAGTSMIFASEGGADPILELSRLTGTALSLDQNQFEQAKRILARVEDPSRLGYILAHTAYAAAQGSNLAPNAHNYELDLLRLLIAKGAPVNYRDPGYSQRPLIKVIETYYLGREYGPDVYGILRAAQI